MNAMNNTSTRVIKQIYLDSMALQGLGLKVCQIQSVSNRSVHRTWFVRLSQAVDTLQRKAVEI